MHRDRDRLPRILAARIRIDTGIRSGTGADCSIGGRIRYGGNRLGACDVLVDEFSQGGNDAMGLGELVGRMRTRQGHDGHLSLFPP